MNNLKYWLEAFRLRTLPLALSSIGMGSFLAYKENAFSWKIFTLACLTTTLLQILSNLANDYGDSVHGADSKDRTGPARAVQQGHISPKSMKKAIYVFSILSFICGISLILISFGSDYRYLIGFLLLGLASIFAAITYTAGKKPYGYQGLGDISVLIFFGLVGVLGSCFLYTKSVNLTNILPSLSSGLFAVAVLNLNNIRDIKSDKIAGKNSIPVMIGREKAVFYHWTILILGFSFAMIYTLINYSNPLQFVFLISIPLLIKNAMAVKQKVESKDLDPYLKQMAISSLIFTLSFGLGLILS